MKRMVLNNLRAHLMRNKNTSSIFTMALGFIIFIMVSYKLLMQTNAAVRNARIGSAP